MRAKAKVEPGICGFETDVMEMIKSGCASESFKAMAQAMPAMHCPRAVMNAVFGAVKTAAGLALPKDIGIAFVKEG